MVINIIDHFFVSEGPYFWLQYYSRMRQLTQCWYSNFSFRIIVVQSEPTEPIEIEDDKFATIRPNDSSSVSITEQVEYSSEQQASTLTNENIGVNLYILAGHEDMRLQF